jgi:hypothetical protein
MKQVKQTAEYTIFQKKSGRYAVQRKGRGKPWLHAEEKANILLAEALIVRPTPKAPAEAEAAPADESAAS